MNKHIQELNDQGYSKINNIKEEVLKQFIENIGKIAQTTEVNVNTKSKNLVTSDRGLDLHTDHHSIDYIAWFCHRQSSIGGESILLDTLPVFKKFNHNELKKLEKIILREHKVFKNDTGQAPMINLDQSGNIRIYYSFWHVNQNDKLNPVFNQFRNAISSCCAIKIKLMPGDALIINNRRVLHGRLPIEGDKNRHLTRYWIHTTASI